MSGWRPGISVEAERGLRELNRVRVLVGTGRTVSAGLSAAAALRSDVNETGVVRAFSVVESYLTVRADVLLHRDLPIPAKRSSMQAFVHERVVSGFRGQFENPVKFWSGALDVSLAKGPGWEDLNDYKDLRNSLVHALGFIRPGEEKIRRGVEKRLKAITKTPETFVGRVPVSDGDFDDLAALADEFVRWADAAYP